MWSGQSCLRAGFRLVVAGVAEAGSKPACKQDCLPHYGSGQFRCL